MSNALQPSCHAAVRWRTPTRADLPICLDIQPAHLGAELVGEARARELWTLLIDHPACSSAVYDTDDGAGGARIVGFSAFVFVRSSFAADELRDPRPGLNARVIASLDRGPSILLSAGEIARSNAGAGLDVVVLYGSWPEQGVTAALLLELQMMLVASIVRLHAGFRIHTMLSVGVGAQIPYRRSSGVVTELAAFPELGQVYHVMRTPDVFANPSSGATSLYQHRTPVLGLTDCEQELLTKALGGATDSELADAIGLSVAGVKARWRSIFARFAKVDPGHDGDAVERTSRGRQKRHHVLSYVRQRPEELWPSRTNLGECAATFAARTALRR